MGAVVRRRGRVAERCLHGQDGRQQPHFLGTGNGARSHQARATPTSLSVAGAGPRTNDATVSATFSPHYDLSGLCYWPPTLGSIRL